MSGEKARQLVGRHQEIDARNDEQDDAEQSENELHGLILLKSTQVERLALSASPFLEINPDSRLLVNVSGGRLSFSSWPASSRPSTSFLLNYYQGVDARHKARGMTV